MPADKKDTYTLEMQPNPDGTHLILGFEYEGAFVPVEAYQTGYLDHLVATAKAQAESK